MTAAQEVAVFLRPRELEAPKPELKLQRSKFEREGSRRVPKDMCTNVNLSMHRSGERSAASQSAGQQLFARFLVEAWSSGSEAGVAAAQKMAVVSRPKSLPCRR